MAILYFLALIPVIIGGVIWVLNKQVNWIEWAGGAGAAFLLAAFIHLIGVYSIPSDTQTVSGQIIQAKHFTAWKEYYEEAVYKTVYSGTGKNRTSRRVFSHWSPRSRWHDEYFKLYSNIDTDITVDEGTYRRTVQLFGEEKSVKGDRRTMEHASRMVAGDPNDRVTTPVSGYVYPVTDSRTWENKIKVGPSVFSFVDVPKNIPVYPWPANPNVFASQRLLGTAAKVVDIYEWDKLNAQVGPLKKVNLIAIGFGNQDSSIAQYQRAKYLGGKKNDLVICYGGDDSHPTWTFVFGWTDSEIVKQNLQSLVLDKGFGPATLADIKEEVIRNYKIKDWSAFDHIAVPPTTTLIVCYIIAMIITQGGLYFWFHQNEWKCELRQ